MFDNPRNVGGSLGYCLGVCGGVLLDAFAATTLNGGERETIGIVLPCGTGDSALVSGAVKSVSVCRNLQSLIAACTAFDRQLNSSAFFFGIAGIIYAK